MDQIKIGRFIAQTRKARRLTQRQLADALGISDKTVSQWECGNGLPEVSLMLPLCDALGITVNDLLSAERVAPANYQKRAEENLLDLMQANQENKKRMALSAVCGAVTLIAVCALLVIAAYLPLPTALRAALVALAAAAGAAGFLAAGLLQARAGYYECPHCRALFVPTPGEYVKGRHTFTKRRLTCPECGKAGMCRHRIVR